MLDARGPALRVKDLKSRKVIRVNQSNVRLVPVQKDYDEIDPLPEHKKSNGEHPVRARPIPDETLNLPLHLSQ